MSGRRRERAGAATDICWLDATPWRAASEGRMQVYEPQRIGEDNSKRKISGGREFVGFDGGRIARSWIPSLRGRRGNLPAGSGENSESAVVPSGPRVFCLACQLDVFSQSDRALAAGLAYC